MCHIACMMLKWHVFKRLGYTVYIWLKARRIHNPKSMRQVNEGLRDSMEYPKQSQNYLCFQYGEENIHEYFQNEITPSGPWNASVWRWHGPRRSHLTLLQKVVTEFVISIQAYIMYYPSSPRVDKHIRHKIKRIRRRLIYFYFVHI